MKFQSLPHALLWPCKPFWPGQLAVRLHPNRVKLQLHPRLVAGELNRALAGPQVLPYAQLSETCAAPSLDPRICPPLTGGIVNPIAACGAAAPHLVPQA